MSVTKLKIRRMSIYTERACPHKRQHFGSEGTRRYRKSYCRTGERSDSFRSSYISCCCKAGPKIGYSASTALTMLRMTSVARCARLPPVGSMTRYAIGSFLASRLLVPGSDLKSSQDWVRFAKTSGFRRRRPGLGCQVNGIRGANGSRKRLEGAL